MAFKAARCPRCSEALQLPDDRSTVKCMYCGLDIDVSEAIGLSTGDPVGNYQKLAREAEKSGNSEEAYRYYTRVLEFDPDNWEAWFGKAEAAGRLSSLADFRLPELLNGFQIALAKCPDDKKEETQKRAAIQITVICMHYEIASTKHCLEFISVDNIWEEHVSRTSAVLEGLDEAYKYDPSNIDILKSIITISNTLIKGATYKKQKIGFFGDPIQVLEKKSISPGQKNMLELRVQAATDEIRKAEPSYNPRGARTDGPCFIATAVAGDFNHPDVILLRKFRDIYLRNLIFGSSFIDSYYYVGPLIAPWISRHGCLRKSIYYFIIKPLVWFANRKLSESSGSLPG
jgi:hypothetical protein